MDISVMVSLYLFLSGRVATPLCTHQNPRRLVESYHIGKLFTPKLEARRELKPTQSSVGLIGKFLQFQSGAGWNIPVLLYFFFSHILWCSEIITDMTWKLLCNGRNQNKVDCMRDKILIHCSYIWDPYIAISLKNPESWGKHSFGS